jgi:cell wall assembly regulator SMI1
MDVTELWTEILDWLTESAPVTAAALRKPESPPDFRALEQEFDVELPLCLREWWTCSDGTDDGVLADVLPPFYTPYGAHRAWEAWNTHRTTWKRQWDRPACDFYAGSAGQSFHPAWIPIAGDGFADELVVDLRPGALHGCVLEWEQEAGRVLRPEWAGVPEMLADVRRALVDGTPAGHSHPTVTEDGRLDWQIS